MNSDPLLKWTGHPLADVGVATLCAMTQKSNPEELTLGDLDAAGMEIRRAYTDPIMSSYLVCVFTTNAPYTNATTGQEKRERDINRLLLPHRGVADGAAAGRKCIFTGLPATHLLERSQMPMLTGAGVLNFFPAGQSELPVTAPYLLAIQAIALGGRRSEGKLLIVHCDDPRWTLLFASRYLNRNRILIDMARAGRLPERDGPDESLDRECAGWDTAKKRPKYPDAKAPQSLVMDDLVEIVTQTNTGAMAQSPTSVTVYLLSNSGQGPSLAIEQIPSEFVGFLQSLRGAKYQSKWNRLVSRAWQAAKGSSEVTGESPKGKGNRRKATPSANVTPSAGRSRNDLYNNLLAIFEHGFINSHAATRFIRRHLLFGAANLYISPDRMDTAPRFGPEQLELIDWELTFLFLHKVLGMNAERLDQIREFADRLAVLISEHNDKALFRKLVFTSAEWEYRAELTKVQREYARTRNKLLFDFQTYLNVFLTSDGEDRTTWSLARDLISIRLVEQLFVAKFFERQQNADALETREETASVGVSNGD